LETDALPIELHPYFALKRLPASRGAGILS
jgi:hypothetical protein